jgi:Sel1 repeat
MGRHTESISSAVSARNCTQKESEITASIPARNPCIFMSAIVSSSHIQSNTLFTQMAQIAAASNATNPFCEERTKMKARAVFLILIFAACVPTLFAQYKDSGSAKSNAEMLNRWVQKERGLAAKGNADAQEMLGNFYYLGTGVHQDYTQAAIWFRKAADKGDPGAQGMLGDLYLEGEGVPQDYRKAYFWLDLASARRSSLVQAPPENAPQAFKNFSQSTRARAMSAVTADRDEAASHLTRSELLRVQESAEKWLQSHKQ